MSSLFNISLVPGDSPFHGPALSVGDYVCKIDQRYWNAQVIPSTDSSMFHSWWEELSPVENADPNVFEWVMKAVGNHYLDMRHSTICIHARVVKENGEVVPANEEVTVENLPFYTMWSDLTLRYNERLIFDGGRLYSHSAYIDRLVKTPTVRGAWTIKKDWYYPAATLHTDDPGFQARFGRTLNSRVVSLVGWPQVGLLQQPLYIVPGSTIRLTLRLNDPKKFLVKSSSNHLTEPYRLEVLKARLQLHKKIILEPIMAFHRRHADLGRRFEYRYNDTEATTFTIDAGAESYELQNLVTGRPPDMMCFAILRTADFNGKYSTSAHHYELFGLSTISLLMKNGPESQCLALRYAYDEEGNIDPSSALDALAVAGNLNADKRMKAEQFLAGQSVSVFNLLGNVRSSLWGNDNVRMSCKLDFVEPLQDDLIVIITARLPWSLKVKTATAHVERTQL